MYNFLIEFCASFLIYFLYFGLLILWVIDGKIKKEQVLHAIFSSVIALVFATLFKILDPTPRPFMVNGGETSVFIKPMDGSFPSEHTIAAFAVAVTIFLHDRKVGLYFLFAALVVGYARVAANIHYPIDIIGGAFIGTLSAVIADKVHFAKFFKKNR